MPQYKYSAKYGATSRGDVAIAAGSAEPQSDTVSINLDVTKMSRADAVHVIEKIKAKILSEAWPPSV